MAELIFTILITTIVVMVSGASLTSEQAASCLTVASLVLWRLMELWLNLPNHQGGIFYRKIICSSLLSLLDDGLRIGLKLTVFPAWWSIGLIAPLSGTLSFNLKLVQAPSGVNDRIIKFYHTLSAVCNNGVYEKF